MKPEEPAITVVCTIKRTTKINTKPVFIHSIYILHLSQILEVSYLQQLDPPNTSIISYIKIQDPTQILRGKVISDSKIFRRWWVLPSRWSGCRFCHGINFEFRRWSRQIKWDSASISKWKFRDGKGAWRRRVRIGGPSPELRERKVITKRHLPVRTLKIDRNCSSYRTFLMGFTAFRLSTW